MPKKPKVSVEVEQEAYDRYRQRAAQLGMSLSDLTRLALDRMAPAPSEDGTGAAFAALDEQDKRTLPRAPLRPVVAPRRIEPLPPAPPPVAASLGVTPGHPCANFRPTTDPGRLPSTCAVQNGRPCAFPARVASQCDLYTPRGR